MLLFNSKAVLSRWKPRDAAVNFDMYPKYTMVSRGPPCDSTAFLYCIATIIYDYWIHNYLDNVYEIHNE